MIEEEQENKNDNLNNFSNNNNNNSNNQLQQSQSLPQISELSTEEKLKIITEFQDNLKSIDLKQETIERISLFARENILKYSEQITPELLQVIDSEAHFTPRLEYLYVINDLLQNLLSNKDPKINIEKNSILIQIFPYIKNICSCSYLTLNETFREKIRELIKLWENMKIFPNEWIKELKFELNMLIEPELSDDKDEENFLINLVNNGKIIIDQNLVEFSKVMEELDRTKDNKYRKTLLRMEKDIIGRQMRVYNNHIQQLKEIDLLLDKIKTFNEFENAEDNNHK